jgi:hypothetical protein
MINAKLQNLYNIKNDIGTAIVNKGGTITESTPFYSYAGQIDNISTGTPQTVFQDSTGAKWARTNVVNLTNVSNNVTSDFNWWQPANNTTSDAILNVGTVGANISGNIRLVPVNQVNIAQYVNLVATDTAGAKYEGFNGYDSQTNPTPTGNTTFNRWLLNNSATGTVVFANATFTTGTYNGPNTTFNESSMPFVNNTSAYSTAGIYTITINNGFIYAGGFGDGFSSGNIRKYHESNLVFVGNSPSYEGGIRSLTTNNGFIYAGGQSNRTVQKFHESNLVRVGNTLSYPNTIQAILINNGFIYAGGLSGGVSKYHEGNLAFSANTVNFTNIYTIAINNGFLYAGGRQQDFLNRSVSKFHESNLVLVGNVANYADGEGTRINSVVVNNGFIYIAGLASGNDIIRKFNDSTLGFVSNSPNYGGAIQSLTINRGFIYAGGTINQTVQKFHESNLVRAGNTPIYGGDIEAITTNNGFIYAAGTSNRTVQKFQETGTVLDNQTFYTATKIKE